MVKGESRRRCEGSGQKSQDTGRDGTHFSQETGYSENRRILGCRESLPVDEETTLANIDSVEGNRQGKDAAQDDHEQGGPRRPVRHLGLRNLLDAGTGKTEQRDTTGAAKESSAHGTTVEVAARRRT
jgi:hypothetical protein